MVAGDPMIRCPLCGELYYPVIGHMCRTTAQITYTIYDPVSGQFKPCDNSIFMPQPEEQAQHEPGIIEQLSAQIASLEQTQLRMQRHIERRDKIISGLRGALHRIASGNVTPENAPALAAKALFENDYHSDVDEAAGLLEE